MTDNYIRKERREFLRYEYEKPVHFSIVSSPKDTNPISPLIKAVSRNLSASGIFFVTDAQNVPDVSSLVILDLDYKTAHICREIEKRAMIKNNKLLGRVVRIDDNEDGTCGVGIAFVTKGEQLNEDVNKVTKE